MSIKNLITIFFIVFSIMISFGGESVFAAACGSANNGAYISPPTSGLCASGATSKVTAHGVYGQATCTGTPPWPYSSYNGSWNWWCGGSSGAACHATDPYLSLKAMFGATQVVSYTGSINSPTTVSFWMENFCSSYTAPSGYTVSSCTAGSTGTHGGCTCCAMANVVLAAIPVPGQCGTANGHRFLSTDYSYASYPQCSLGTATSGSFPMGGIPANWYCNNSGTNSPQCTATQNRKASITNGNTYYSVNASSTVSFTGFSASDADSDTLTYAWTCTNGGTFTDNSIVNPQYIAPATATTDTCTLIVSDGYEGTLSSTVIVTVNAPPPGQCGTANGHRFLSTDSSYTSYPQCSLGTSTNTTFPTGGTPSNWYCNNSGTNSPQCTATRNRRPTVINGTMSYSVSVNQTTNFTGFSASDADSDTLTYAWTCTNGGTFTDNSIVNPQYIAPATAGTDTCFLIASDGYDGGVSSSVTVTATNITTTALNFKSPLDIATAIGSTDESCWYCSHYRNTSNAITSALGGAAGNLQFKFDYQSSAGNMTGYQFAIGPTNDVSAATTIKSSDWVSASGASGTTVTVDSINGLPVSVKISPSQAMSQLAYGTTYYWWVKVKNATEESDWVSAGTYATSSHHYPDVKVVYTGSGVNNFQACTTVKSLTGTHNDDPCFSACWKGSGNAIDLNSSNWVCSTCYNSSTNLPQLCGTNTITWTLPSNKPTGFNFRTGSTSTTNNPIFTSLASGQTVNLQVDIAGSSCPLEQGLSGSTTPMPKWYEVSPF